jgi:hypothetical protein
VNLTSSCVSDGVLCLATAVSAFVLWRTGRRSAALCLFFVAAAALLGSLYFAGVSDVATWHDRLSFFAATAAVPAFCWVYWRSLAARHAPHLLVTMLLLVVLYLIAHFFKWPPYPTVIGAIGLVLALWGTLASRKAATIVPGTLAVILYAAAGLVIGAVGSWHGWARVDLYHYALAIANLLFVLALRQAPRSA